MWNPLESPIQNPEPFAESEMSSTTGAIHEPTVEEKRLCATEKEDQEAHEEGEASHVWQADCSSDRAAADDASDSVGKDQEEHEEVEDQEDVNTGITSDMFKRLRLHRSSSFAGAENDDTEQRNENGLATRVKRSLKKKPTQQQQQTTTPSQSQSKPMFATVCVNNVNRSMEAHVVLQDAGLKVCSFGAGSQVCFPGRTATTPRIFSFDTTYETMYNRLQAEDDALYTSNGVLRMLERNMSTKKRPRRWHSLSNKQLQELDVIVCLDYNMFIKVLNDLRMRIRFCFQKKQLHVICLDTEDTFDDAISGGVLALELCQEIDQLEPRSEANVKDVVVRFETKHKMDMFYIGLTV